MVGTQARPERYTEFGKLAYGYIAKKYGTIVAFADAVGIASSTVTDVLRGRRKPDVERWIQVLRLRGSNRAQFLVTAYLSMSPKVIQDEFRKMEAELEALGKR